MPVDTSTLRESRERDRRAVYVGTVVTTIATLVLFVLPKHLPVQAFLDWYAEVAGTRMYGNPFLPLRLLGGVIGGAVAGWRTSDFGEGLVTGVKAALFGLIVAYILAIVAYILYSVAVGAALALIPIMTIGFVYAIPLFGSHLIGGAVAGLLAQRLTA